MAEIRFNRIEANDDARVEPHFRTLVALLKNSTLCISQISHGANLINKASVTDECRCFSLPLTQNYSLRVYETDIPMNITVQATYTTCGTILTKEILLNRIESSLNFNRV